MSRKMGKNASGAGRLLAASVLLVALCGVPAARAAEQETAGGGRTGGGDAEPAEQGKREAAASPELFSTATTALGIDVFRALAGKGRGNLAISPFSIEAALGMTRLGARGRTAEEMDAVLHIEEEAAFHTSAAAAWERLEAVAKGPLELAAANRIFVEERLHLRPEFVERTATLYHAPVERTPFGRDPEGSRMRINTWVEKQTQSHIRDLLPPRSIDPMTRLVLVDALYFSGRWASRFERSRTRPAPFQAYGERRVKVPMMRQEGTFKYAEVEGAQVLEMPYQGGALSMVIVLPREPTGLPALERALSAETLDRWLSALSPRRVRVSLPRFTLRPKRSIPLGSTLKTLGMPTAFTPEADFTGMIEAAGDRGGLFIDAAFHQVFVEVREEGTRAAAATAVVIRTRGGGGHRQLKPVVFRADRPFLFLIRDTKSQLLLFLGRVTHPRA